MMAGASQPKKNRSREDDMFSAAHDYAWNWFQYHAGQRMNVFRFYFIVIAILFVGMIKFYDDNQYVPLIILSLMVVVVSFLFYRLDTRSADLIKISERFLKKSEDRMSKLVGEEIKLTAHADKKDNDFTKQYNTTYFFSFRKIFRWFFVIFGFLGLLGALMAGMVMHQGYCPSILADQQTQKPAIEVGSVKND